MSLYLDSSATVKLFAVEAETSHMRSLIRSTLQSDLRIFVSSLTKLETVRSLRRKGANPDPAIAFFQRVDTVALGVAEFEQAQLVGPTSLRSLDALHVAAAQRISPLGIRVVTYDERLQAAARQAGFEVLSPGL